MAPFSLPYHIYHDLDIINNDYKSSPPHLRFEETRNAPYLDGDSSEYFVSIIRFSIQTANSLPLFIPQIDTSASDVNTTIYKISFVYTKTGATYTSTKNLMFTPTVPYVAGQALPYNYYYIYNYSEIMKMVNATFNELMNTGDIALAASAFTSNYFGVFMEIDPSTLRCSITSDKQFFVNRYNGKNFVDSPNIQVYFNTALKSLFPTFPYRFNSSTTDLNYNLIFEDLYGVNTIQVCTNTLDTLNNLSTSNINRPGIQIAEEISSISLWNPVASIVFSTSLLPIVQTQTSMPKIFNSSSNTLRITGEPNIGSILTDFQISISPGNDYRDNITYVLTGEPRLLDMYSSYNLNKIDLIVYWKDIFGNLNPIYLQPGCNANVKLMFRRKHFYLA